MQALACAACLFASVAQAQDGSTTYVVQPGDTLAKIALLATGDAMRHEELFYTNEDALDRAGGLQVGMRLTLPDGWSMPDLSNVPKVQSSGKQELDEDGVSGDTVLTPREPPAPNLWDRLAFFPALRELEQDFETLMLRTAYEGDIGWGEAQVENQRSTAREQLEQQILQAEVERDRTQALKEDCDKAAYRAEILLSKFRRYDDNEFEKRSKDILRRLGEAVWEEQQIWEGKLWPYITPSGRNAWTDFAASLENSRWTEAIDRHRELDIYRVGLDRDVTIEPDEALAYSGEATDKALYELQDLRNEKAYTADVHERQKYKEALLAIQNHDDCVREFYDAEDFLKEKRRKLVSVQIGLGIGSSDALSVEARRVANRFSGVLAEVQLVDAFLTNRMWSGLWWKAGVALRLAGDHDLGSTRLAQAASVAQESRLPEGAVPPSVEAWLRAAENEVLRGKKGNVHVLVPPLAKLTVDGVEVEHTFGETDLELAPGIHRFVFWVGKSEPIMRLVGVVEDGEHDFIWYSNSNLGGEEEAVIGEVPKLPTLPSGPQTKRWHVGVTPMAGLSLGRPTFGVDLSVRYLPLWIGGELGLSVLVPSEPLWLRPREDLFLFARIHGGVALRARANRFTFVGRVGGYTDPLLGAGPHGRLEFAYEVKKDEKLRLALDLTGGYDLTVHESDIPRYILAGGIGLWF
jgi:hypothetical protein